VSLTSIHRCYTFPFPFAARLNTHPLDFSAEEGYQRSPPLAAAAPRRAASPLPLPAVPSCGAVWPTTLGAVLVMAAASWHDRFGACYCPSFPPHVLDLAMSPQWWPSVSGALPKWTIPVRFVVAAVLPHRFAHITPHVANWRKQLEISCSSEDHIHITRLSRSIFTLLINARYAMKLWKSIQHKEMKSAYQQRSQYGG